MNELLASEVGIPLAELISHIPDWLTASQLAVVHSIFATAIALAVLETKFPEAKEVKRHFTHIHVPPIMPSLSHTRTHHTQLVSRESAA